MKVRLLISCCFCAVSLLSQKVNIVKNPSFELGNPNIDYKECSYTKDALKFTKAVPNWTSFLKYTPDLIIQSSETADDCFYPQPHSGTRMAGIITYHPSIDTGYDYDYHEYLQGELKAPLQVGRDFLIEFYVLHSDSVAVHHLKMVYGRDIPIIPAAANSLGFYFLEKPINTKADIWGLVKENAIQPHFMVHEIIENKNDDWVKISGIITADKPYKYFLIGNFFPDKMTKTNLVENSKIESFNENNTKFWGKAKRIAYYCIDDIRIAPADLEPIYNIEHSLVEKQIYTFKNVNFGTGKWELQPDALPELNGLAHFLIKNPDLKIEIGGHTDNIGNAESNKILSENRAKAVRDFLIGKGIGERQLIFKGFSETQPIQSNETEAGRLMNRRVECKVLE